MQGKSRRVAQKKNPLCCKQYIQQPRGPRICLEPFHPPSTRPMSAFIGKNCRLPRAKQDTPAIANFTSKQRKTWKKNNPILPIENGVLPNPIISIAPLGKRKEATRRPVFLSQGSGFPLNGPPAQASYPAPASLVHGPTLGEPSELRPF